MSGDSQPKVFDRTPAQLLAADPARHVWVAASAGTGKTHVLTDRMLRLLLAGSAPDRILALTFTKAAAAEMQNRLVTRLGQWQGHDDSTLDAELKALGLPPGDALRNRARSLFALALDVPGGLKVQTIHAFAQGLLAAFPLEAGLPPGFRALDDRDARTLRQRALAESITEAQAAGDDRFLVDLAELSILKGEGGVMQALDRMIAHSEGILAFASEDALQPAIRRWLEVSPDEQPGERLAALLGPDMFDDGRLAGFADALERWGWKPALQKAEAARAWLALDAEGRFERFEDLRALLLTGKDEIRSFKQGEPKSPGIQSLAEDIAADVLRLMDFDKRLLTAELATRALRAGHRIVGRYRRLKRAAVAIDYDDMIAETARLLGPEGVPGYVAWKLDSRFDHVLVDEAQDTNARQWAIVGRLVEEYFAPDDDRTRSLFVVGDTKQSIYGFQGTDPQLFEAGAARLSPAAQEAGRSIERVDLDLSFRSGPAVLDVVNAFLEAATPESLGMQAAPPPHQPHRRDAPGEVVLWPVVTLSDEASDEADDSGEGSEAADREMAARLALQVAAWLKRGSPERLWLPARKRHARPEDILILLRRRSWLMGALVSSLHQARVPVAGVDRLLLTEPLAVLDCLACVRFAVQPEDDLTLATLLISPFLGWDHESIRRVSGGRKGLWAALGRAQSQDPQAAQARSWLGQLLALADTVGPYRFLDTILSGPLRGRKRLLARLGREANDPIDELLAQALAYEQSNPPALAGFLHWIESEGSDVKRDADAPSGQVRLMTIHGAKGLEAPVVVLADAAHQRRPRQDGFIAVDLDGGNRVPLFHPPGPDCPKKLFAERERLKALDDEEDLRLFYVGLTRAADHLYVGGAVAKGSEEKLGTDGDRCWHSLLAPVLQDLPGAERIETRWGETLRLRRGSWTAPVEAPPTVSAEPARSTVASLALGPAPPIGRPARPLTPSGLPDPPPEGPSALAMKAAAQRGSLIHTLFERLPAVAPEDRADVARAWLQRQGAGPQAETIVGEVLQVLADPSLAALFGPDALAEAPVAGMVGTQTIAGVVDRLLVEPDRLLIVDFKTGLAVPSDAAPAPVAHRRQMAAYAAVLAQAFPGRRVEAALLYTAAPKFLLLAEKDMEGLLSLD